jgi:hypothetical protein
MKEEMTTTASAGIPQDTKNMGPRFRATDVTDRRYSKKKAPVLLRRFREYLRNDNAQSKAEKK